MLKKYINIVSIGILLLVLYILQDLFNWQWEWMYNLQLNQGYKRWSGVFVMTFILFQWLLTLTRIIPKLRKRSILFTSLHKKIGALSPLFFYIHAMEFGYGYLLILSIIFFTNMILGTVNLDLIKSHKNWIFQSWMIIHVALSVIITFMMFFHVGVVFYYE